MKACYTVRTSVSLPSAKTICTPSVLFKPAQSKRSSTVAMSDARNQREAASELHPGDHVEWGAPVPGRRKASGEVVEVVTEDTAVGKNHFKASEDNPKVRVKSGKTGKEAVHKPTSVRKVEDGAEEEEEEEDDDEEQ